MLKLEEQPCDHTFISSPLTEQQKNRRGFDLWDLTNVRNNKPCTKKSKAEFAKFASITLNMQ
jgi:hypothetical protein